MYTEMRRFEHMSFSQLSTYVGCGERYRIEKGYELGNVNWWATLAGSVIHRMTERHDMGTEVMPYDIGVLYDRFLAEMTEERDKVGGEIRASGFKQENVTWRGGPNKRDFLWWMEYGPQVLLSYLDWRKETGWEIATIQDKPAIEWEFTVEIGGVPVQGQIDRIFWDGEKLIIIDLKTGMRKVFTTLQLATYRLAVRRETGLEVNYGGFAKPTVRQGQKKVTWDVHVNGMMGWHDEYVDHIYAMARKGIEGNIFLPNVNACRDCGVAEYCNVRQGELAGIVPMIEGGL